MKLSIRQIEILQDCRIEENKIYLQWELDNK